MCRLFLVPLGFFPLLFVCFVLYTCVCFSFTLFLKFKASCFLMRDRNEIDLNIMGSEKLWEEKREGHP